MPSTQLLPLDGVNIISAKSIGCLGKVALSVPGSSAFSADLSDKAFERELLSTNL